MESWKELEHFEFKITFWFVVDKFKMQTWYNENDEIDGKLPISLWVFYLI